MKLIDKLVKKNLVLNKQRSIATIVGIILCCALISALMTLVTSLQTTLVEDSLINYGNRHVTLYNVDSDLIDELENNKYVESLYTTSESLMKDSNGTYAGLISIDTNGVNDLDNLLQLGRVPENEEEIVVDSIYYEENDLNIGDIIVLEQGQRYSSDGYLLNGFNLFNEDDVFEVSTSNSYTLVGVSNYITFLSNNNYGHNFYTCTKNVSESINAFILYTDPSECVTITSLLLEISGASGHEYNSEFLRWSGYSLGGDTLEALYLLAAIVSAIIVITSVFCIRNSFAISSSEKTRLFGMLASIGATPKQIKSAVLKEGFYLGVIGIPIGIVSGTLASYILVIVVNYFFSDIMSDFVFLYHFSWIGIFISVILSSVTIYLSAIGSARKASKITEIEAIKQLDSIQKTKKQIKTPKIIKKVFGISGVFAYKNMLRNKSKFRTTIISLVVSISTFLSLSYFIHVGFLIVDDMYGTASYNLMIQITDDDVTKTEIEEVYEKVINNKEVEESILHHYIYVYGSKDTLVEDSSFYQEYSYYNMMLLSLDDDSYQALLDEQGLEEEVIDTGIVVYNQSTTYDEELEKMVESEILRNDLQTFELYDYEGELLVDLDILFALDCEFMGCDNFYSGTPIIVVSESMYDSLPDQDKYSIIYLSSNDSVAVNSEMEEYLDLENISFYSNNLAEEQMIQNNVIILMSIFLYGFICVIILIGVTSIFNTITTNMKLRSKEFAILQSIGMKDNELRSMIRMESIFYGMKSLFWGGILGTCFSYLIYRAYTYEDTVNRVVLSSFKMPIGSIIITVVSVFVIIYIIMSYSLLKMKQQNIIETIKNENI